jgi:hypothetical protein
MTHKPPVILFTFAGRQPNLELQIPMVKRILAENPNVEYHFWNFARNDKDRAFVKSISGERITVWNGHSGDGFSSPAPTGDGNQFGANEHNAAYLHYSQPQFKDHLFVKVDDDIVFLETARFHKFVEAIDANRDKCLVANIINNGGCTPVNPTIWEGFQKIGQPLLDIHIGNKFPDMAHRRLFEHPDEFLNQPIELVPTADWLSINAVGYSWDVLVHVLKTIGKPQPAFLSGRPMHGWGRVFGDEGVFQTLDRLIVKGFTAAHLTFGPQKPTANQLAMWLQGYRRLGEQYLASDSNDDGGEGLPEPSEMSCGYVGVRSPKELKKLTPEQRAQAITPAEHERASHVVQHTMDGRDWRSRWAQRAAGENDPCAGRYVP